MFRKTHTRTFGRRFGQLNFGRSFISALWLLSASVMYHLNGMEWVVRRPTDFQRRCQASCPS